MISRKQSKQKQIDELRKNLDLIEVRKSEYVQATDIPLQLIKAEEETLAKLAALDAELRTLSSQGGIDPPSINLWWIIGIAVILIVANFATWLWLGRSPSQPENGLSLTEMTSATAAPVNENMASPPTEPVATSLPTLPDMAPTLPTSVLLLSSPICATELSKLAEFLTISTNELTPPVMFVQQESVQHTATDRDTVRTAGAAAAADLVIWCTEEASAGFTLHFDVLTQRSVPEVCAPSTFSSPVVPVARSQRTALGMVHYTRRDYVNSEATLRTAISMSPQGIENAPAMLLIGNSQLFRRQYDKATMTFSTTLEIAPTWACAWHNLGVAHLNANFGSVNLGSAQEALEEARRLDPENRTPLVLLARILLWFADEKPANYDEALALCASAEHSSIATERALGEVCTGMTQIVGANLGLKTELPNIQDPVVLEKAVSPYWAEPLAILGLIEEKYWAANSEPVAQKRAQDYLHQYLFEAQDDVLLEESRSRFRHIIEWYLPRLEKNRN